MILDILSSLLKEIIDGACEGVTNKHSCVVSRFLNKTICKYVLL